MLSLCQLIVIACTLCVLQLTLHGNLVANINSHCHSSDRKTSVSNHWYR